MSSTPLRTPRAGQHCTFQTVQPVGAPARSTRSVPRLRMARPPAPRPKPPKAALTAAPLPEAALDPAQHRQDREKTSRFRLVYARQRVALVATVRESRLHHRIDRSVPSILFCRPGGLIPSPGRLVDHPQPSRCTMGRLISMLSVASSLLLLSAATAVPALGGELLHRPPARGSLRVPNAYPM